MENNHKEEIISQFYSNLKKLTDYYEIEKVSRLLDQTVTSKKPGLRILSNKTKIIIMSTILALIALLVIWSFQNRDQRPETDNEIRVSKDTSVYIAPESNTIKSTRKSIHHYNVRFDIDTIKIIDQKSDEINRTDTIEPAFTEPIDTTYLIQDLLVFLSDSEMLKIGIKITDSTLFYMNMTGGLPQFSLGNYSDAYYYEELKRFYSNHQKDLPFYALYYSNGNYESTMEDFLQSRDTLVPVVFNWNRFKNITIDDKYILWFTPHHDLFDSLPTRYHGLYKIYQNLKTSKEKYPDRSLVVFPAPKLDGINLIELNKPELENLGFRFYTDSITSPPWKTDHHLTYYRSFEKYRDTLILGGAEGTIGLRLGGERLSVSESAGNNINSGTYLPEIMFTSNNIGELEHTGETDDPNTLIPIILRKDMYPVLYHDIVFWFVPNESLFERLPQSIGNRIRDEYNAVITNNHKENLNSSCTYFEVCRSTWYPEDLRIYPNPAQSSITIDFTSEEDITGSVLLMNSSGVQIRQLISKTIFQSGFNRFTINLEGLIPGLYLVTIMSEKGFITQRLIILRP